MSARVLVRRAPAGVDRDRVYVDVCKSDRNKSYRGNPAAGAGEEWKEHPQP